MDTVAEVGLAGTAHEGTTSTTSPAPPLPPDALIIIPVRNVVLFPGHVMPITIGRPGSVAAAQQALRYQRQVGILMQRSPDVADPAPTDMPRFGSVATSSATSPGSDGTNHLICQGDKRFQVLEFLSGWPFLVARVLRIPEPDPRSREIEARFFI
jgi:ATP-dependent Lon protease